MIIIIIIITCRVHANTPIIVPINIIFRVGTLLLLLVLAVVAAVVVVVVYGYGRSCVPTTTTVAATVEQTTKE